MNNPEVTLTTGTVKPKKFYGYTIVAASFFIEWVTFGLFNTNGVFLNPILAEFGWTRATISVAYTIGFMMMGVMSVAAGNFNDRFGPRRVMALCGIFLGFGVLALSRIGTAWQMYICYLLIGIGMGCVDAVLLSTIARWFTKRRGITTAFTKVAAGLGIFSIPLAAPWLISLYGWRNAYVVLGILLLLVIVPLSRLLRRDPAKMGQSAYGDSERAAGSEPVRITGLTLREAIHTRQFWLVCAIYFADSLCMQTAATHITPHAISLGIGATSAASLISVIGMASIVGRLVVGLACDRIGNRRTMVICLVVLVIGFSWLQVANVLWMLYLFVILDGLNHGGIVTVIAPTVAELFGTREIGTLLGIVLFCGMAIGGIGALLAGYIFDITGSYQIAFQGLMVMAVIGLVMGFAVKPMKKRD